MGSGTQGSHDGTYEIDARDLTGGVVGFRVSIVDGAPSKTWDSSGARCTIGSQEGNDITIDGRTVSRFHCEITIDGPDARIRDLRSKNGTTVDGVRISEAFLRAGSLIRIGGVVLRFDLLDNVSRVPISQRTEFTGS